MTQRSKTIVCVLLSVSTVHICMKNTKNIEIPKQFITFVVLRDVIFQVLLSDNYYLLNYFTFQGF